MKIQSYNSYASFLTKAEGHLLINESVNSFFWEFSKNKQTSNSLKWMGNLFENGLVVGSALVTRNSYLLPSICDKSAIERFYKYLTCKGFRINGILSSDSLCQQANFLWRKNSLIKSIKINKKYMVMECSADIGQQNQITRLNLATEREWPRIWIWAKSFATEVDPQLNQVNTVNLAREMLNAGNLFLLKDQSEYTVGMGGFGRKTPNYLVINMVYINPEMRRKGLAKDLVCKLLGKVKQRGVEKCMLFSDFLTSKNLYSDIGFSLAGRVEEHSYNWEFNPKPPNS